MFERNSKDRIEADTPKPTKNAVPGHSVIGKGTTLSGDCVTEGHIRIEGVVVGDVKANGIELADGGVVDGTLSVPDTGKKGQVFVVSGHVTGRVTAHTVDVKRTGTVLGGIEAEEVTIHGEVKGGVTVRHRLAIASTAVVTGDVETDRLAMEEGGRVNGAIRMGRRSETAAVPLEVEEAPEVDALDADDPEAESVAA